MRTRWISLTAACILGTLAGLTPTAQADPATLLRDIGTGVADTESEPEGRILSLGPLALLSIFEPESGYELWVTDGTDIGTRPLVSGPFAPLGIVGRTGILASGRRYDTDLRVWRSDGTRSGTFPLTPAGGGELFSCGAVAETPSRLFLTARTGSECGLWTTDGTPAGTQELRAGKVSSLTAAGGQVFFVVSDPREGNSLWRSDGTADGTEKLRQGGGPENLVAVGERLFFEALEDGDELWTSDGTAAGTEPLTHFDTPYPFTFGILPRTIPGENQACFLVQEAATGREMWCSDGTPEGTRPVTSLVLANPFEPRIWRVDRLAGRYLFPANDGIGGNRWFTSDGRPESTAPLTGCQGGCPALDRESMPVRVGNRIFFAARGEEPFDPDDPPPSDLWVTDGTGAGTRRLGDFCGKCRVERSHSLLGKLFFSVVEGFFDHTVWASDGTPQGTRRLVPAEDDSLVVLGAPPVAVGGRGLFIYNPETGPGPGLWTSDGTPDGTRELFFLGRNGFGSQPGRLVPTPSGVRFLVREEILWNSLGTAATTARVEAAPHTRDLTAFGSLTLFWSGGLWRTDGTEAGTFQLFPGPLRGPVVAGSRALFSVDGQDGAPAAIWATDGTVAGTLKVAELPGTLAGLSAAGSSALIRLWNDGTGPLLWRTDGTSAGTREIPLPEDFDFGGGSVVQLGSQLYFGASSRAKGRGLWRAGLSGEASQVAADLLGEVGSLAVHAGSLYVVGKKKGSDVQPTGLWRTDGTEQGTVLLASAPWLSSEISIPFTSVGGLLFFVLDDERGRELWRTDGTPAGTLLVRDIVPGAGSSFPNALAALNGRLYFSATSTYHGSELWESDGTEAGTRLVQDIGPGALSSHPKDLVAGGGRLFFTADDGVHGREPWVYVPGGSGCEPGDTALCLGGRFKVEADWRTSEAGGGRGHAAALTGDTGYFWFFDPANVEVILKVLDGQDLNGHHWVFYGALSNVEYTLTVTDTLTGATRRYVNPPGRLGSAADVTAFGPLGASAAGSVTEGPAAETGDAIVTMRSTRATGACAPSSERICLNEGRFAVEARWRDFQGRTGAGQAVPLSGGDTGYFWFFDAANVEVVLKVLDGRPVNNKFWVFYGALSNVEYTLTVTDTESGVVRTYTNPRGRLASVADTGAF